MRHIQGFICIATVKSAPNLGVFLYGKNISNIPVTYSDFEGSDFTPFSDLSGAEQAKVELLGREDIEEVKIVAIKMQIAKTKEEVYEFKKKKNLVVIKITEDRKDLLGKLIEEYPTYLSASFFVMNGLKPFDSFKKALAAIREINRQAQCPATIASLEIEEIKKPF